MVEILTDSCSDLSQEIVQRFGIAVIPLSVFIAGKTYLDGVDITLEELFEQVHQSGELPKTSVPSIANFIDFFSQFEEEMIYISIGAKLSATYQNAMLAAESLPDRKIFIIDSANLSTGIGLLVCKAAELRDQGLSAEQIVSQIREIVGKVRTSFVVDTLEYLYMGGRCSALQNIVGSLLKIRPVIEVRRDGTLGVKEKLRGTRRRALDTLLEDFRDNLSEIDLHRVFVTHSGCEADAIYLRDGLNQLAEIEEICVTRAGATIASHCGPNTIGILYLTQ